MMLFTSSHDGRVAVENAPIEIVTKKEIGEILKRMQAHSDEWDYGYIYKIGTIKSFGNYWVRLHKQPKISRTGHVTIDGIRCNVEYKGGITWWCTPVESVYCIEGVV